MEKGEETIRQVEAWTLEKGAGRNLPQAEKGKWCGKTLEEEDGEKKTDVKKSTLEEEGEGEE